MRALVLAFAACLAVSPVDASEEAAPEAEETADGSPLGGADTTVELPMLVAPVTVSGRLYHYAYMRVLLEAASPDGVAKAYEKVPLILDAMLRETHRESIALGGDPQQIDGNGLKTRLLKAANAAMGEGTFKSVAFRDTIQTEGQEPEPPAETAAAEPKPEAGH